MCLYGQAYASTHSCTHQVTFQLVLTTQVGPTGCVVGIEHIKELVDQSVKNAQKDSLDLIGESSCEHVPIGQHRVPHQLDCVRTTIQ